MRSRRALVTAIAAALVALALMGDSCDTETVDEPDEQADTSSGTSEKPKKQQKEQVAQVGDAITLEGQDGGKVKVTVVKVIDPALGGEFDEVTAGKRRVGVQVSLVNVGDKTYDDSPSNGATIITADDEQGEFAYVSGGVCGGSFASQATISPGSRRVGCLPFEVPKAAKLKTFQFGLDSGFGPQTGEWNLR